MQVTVKDNYLNMRTGLPSVNAPNTQYLSPGQVIEIDGNLYKGNVFQGIDTWVKDLAGNYYWSGGVNLYQQWFTDLNIPQIWQYATGKGVGVAIIDTGVKKDIPNLPLSSNYFVYDGSNNTIDSDGHGTFCAGLVGLQNFQNTSIGVARDCQIFAVKISETGEFSNNETDSIRYANAINWCSSQQDIHVISISWANPVQSAQIKNDIQSAINSAISNGKIIVCAIGDASSYPDNSEYFPVCLNNTIGVGSLPVYNKLYPFINKYLSVILNGDNINSIQIDRFPYSDFGVSWSNAIMAGIISLIIEKLNFNYDLSKIKTIIQNIVTNNDYTIDNTTETLPTLDSDKLLNFFKT